MTTVLFKYSKIEQWIFFKYKQIILMIIVNNFYYILFLLVM